MSCMTTPLSIHLIQDVFYNLTSYKKVRNHPHISLQISTRNYCNIPLKIPYQCNNTAIG
ncbi:hypothetical protein LSTR_LSTR006613 [Laodelphax striatellus]|uniref:Uncharacterized protein n=1 Tax=Laodelphax striatellus TaxID=195883 RepID=A0A482X0L6_LAOST|nr:hypothetical protein LSTR_LSTR006613 [Laodelphax striatellus]